MEKLILSDNINPYNSMFGNLTFQEQEGGQQNGEPSLHDLKQFINFIDSQTVNLHQVTIKIETETAYSLKLKTLKFIDYKNNIEYICANVPLNINGYRTTPETFEVVEWKI